MTLSTIQAESDAARMPGTRGIGAVEALEDARLLFRCEARAPVVHAQRRGAVLRAGAHLAVDGQVLQEDFHFGAA